MEEKPSNGTLIKNPRQSELEITINHLTSRIQERPTTSKFIQLTLNSGNYSLTETNTLSTCIKIESSELQTIKISKDKKSK